MVMSSFWKSGRGQTIISDVCNLRGIYVRADAYPVKKYTHEISFQAIYLKFFRFAGHYLESNFKM